LRQTLRVDFPAEVVLFEGTALLADGQDRPAGVMGVEAAGVIVDAEPIERPRYRFHVPLPALRQPRLECSQQLLRILALEDAAEIPAVEQGIAEALSGAIGGAVGERLGLFEI